MLKIIEKLRLAGLKKNKGKSYSEYLKLQYNRSKSKFDPNDKKQSARKDSLIKLLSNIINLNKIKNALSIGCRDTYELDLFEKKGIGNVTGIDLYSDDKRILVMDMHDLKFPDKSFDLVYCSHSLEHAFDYKKVCSEIVRILKNNGVITIEVPINYEVRGSDLHDFNNAENIINIFSQFANFDILFKDNISKDNNNSGTDIAQVILKINK